VAAVRRADAADQEGLLAHGDFLEVHGLCSQVGWPAPS
jgi:hypothetical protein